MKKRTIRKKRTMKRKKSRIKQSRNKKYSKNHSHFKNRYSKRYSKKLRRGGAISLICAEFKNNEGNYNHILDVFNIDKTYYKISIEINSIRFISIKSFREIIELRDILSSDSKIPGSLREEYKITGSLLEEYPLGGYSDLYIKLAIRDLKTSELTKRISQHFKTRSIRRNDCITRFKEIEDICLVIEGLFRWLTKHNFSCVNLLNKHGFFRFDLKLLDSPLNGERVKELVQSNPNKIAIVDPAGKDILTVNPDNAGKYSGDLYKQLKDSEHTVTKIDISNFTKEIFTKEYGNLSIIHSLGYDFRNPKTGVYDPNKLEEGKLYLQNLYKNIIEEGSEKGLKTLQFVPISGGIFGGSNIQNFPELTINWIKTLYPTKLLSIIAEPIPVIELYIFFPNEAKEYLRAIKKIEAELLNKQ